MTSNEIILIIISMLGFIWSLWGYLKLRNAPIKVSGTKRFLTVDELGAMEGSIEGLEEVIVIADQIESPTKALLASVERNLKNNIKYTFLISPSRFEIEKEGYINIFKGFARAISAENETNNLVDIFALKSDWTNYPYIFYRYREKQQYKVFSYVGTQMKEGIADKYQLIPPAISIGVLKLALGNLSDNSIIDISPQIEENEFIDAVPKLHYEKQKTA